MSLMEKLLADLELAERRAQRRPAPSSVNPQDEFGDLGAPANLSKELVSLFMSHRQSKLRAQARLEEVIRLGYDHKETYAQAMVLKYSALELQDLCGLASLAAKSGCPSPDGGKAAS